MINKFILPLLAVLVLGSCSNKFSLVKRKYNKGYYLDVSKNNSHKAQETEKAVALKSKNTRAVSPQSETAPELKVSEVTPSVVNEKVSAPLAKTYAPAKESKPLVASAKKTLVQVAKAVKPVTEANSKTASGATDSGTNKILLVILALFPVICLIAVYLHDGKKITLNFWITLLLHLTFVLWVIFAVLVVLDVIDLA